MVRARGRRILLLLGVVGAGALCAAQADRTERWVRWVRGLGRRLGRPVPVTRASIVFVGDSLTWEGPFAELLPGVPVVNHGVPGDTTEDVLARLSASIGGQPRHLLLLIGTNDLLRGRSPEATLALIDRIVAEIKTGSPATAITLQSLPAANLGVNPAWRGFSERAHALNRGLPGLAARHGAGFVDLAAAMNDASGALAAAFTYDGLHLRPAAYRRWAELVAPHLS